MFQKLTAISLFCVCAAIASAQTPPPYVSLGDSLTEGVQSADANTATQPNGYANLLAQQMGVSFPLPLIDTSWYGTIESVSGRTRANPSLLVSNLGVSGADTTSMLTQAAGQPIDDETDLVEEPRTGTQVQIAQQLQSPFMTCWIGNNDALGAILAFDQLNATQITPLPVFESNFQQILAGLTGWNDKVVFANIPNVTQIGFLFNNADLQLFLGNSYGLPDGSYTTLAAMLLIRIGVLSPSILQNPNWVLDPTEVQTIQNAITSFNQVIAQDAAAAGMPVVDINGFFSDIQQNPPTFGSVTLTPRYLGGIFSLDGVHPSDIGHALVANAFIQQIDTSFHMSIPQLSQQQLIAILKADPFVDFNNNLRVRGRFGEGLLETLGPFLGISGDLRDGLMAPGIRPELGPQFMRAYFAATGQDPNRSWTTADAVEAMRHILGLERYK